MTLHALGDIDDAIDATRSFLWPFDLGRWAKLAFVAFFLGGVGGANPAQFSGSVPSDSTTTPPTESVNLSELIASISPAQWGLLAAVVGVVLLIGLVFGFIGAVMEFVFVDSLRRERVAIRNYWRDHWRLGARLFGFRLVVGLLSLAVAVGALWVGFGPLFTAGSLSLGAIALSIAALLALAVVTGLLNGFTTQFVVPVMLTERSGVVAGWRRFWPTLTGQWKQYAAYAVLRFVLQIAVGAVVGVAVAVGGLALAIPFLALGLVGVALFSVSSIVGGAVVAVVVALFVLSMIVVGAFAAVPVQTYLRYYALLVLGDTNDAFDLIADRREAIRE